MTSFIGDKKQAVDIVVYARRKKKRPDDVTRAVLRSWEIFTLKHSEWLYKKRRWVLRLFFGWPRTLAPHWVQFRRSVAFQLYVHLNRIESSAKLINVLNCMSLSRLL